MKMKSFLARVRQLKDADNASSADSEDTQGSPSTTTHGRGSEYAESLRSTVLSPGGETLGNSAEELAAIETVSKLNRSMKYEDSPRLKSQVSLAEDHEEIELMMLDSDDEVESVSARRNVVNSSAKAWSAFEHSIKQIGDDSETIVKIPKPNFKASDTFKDVMMDMFGNTEYNHTRGYTKLKEKVGSLSRVTELASRVFANALQEGALEEEEEGNDDEIDGQGAGNLEHKMMTEMFAQRGWKAIKRNIQETELKNKTKDSALKWTMLQQHLKGMSDIQKTRYDLYQRYGIVPIIKHDGTAVMENTMLSDRAKKQLRAEQKALEKSKMPKPRRPLSYQPPSHVERANSANVKQIGASENAKHSTHNVKKKRTRPKTAKK